MAKKAEADKPEAGVVVNGVPVEEGRAGKGRATPSRREQQAARKRPLVPTDRKAARVQSRTQVSSERERARLGALNGDERYLPQNERGPQRKFVRDSIDARYMVLEATVPLAILALIVTLAAGQSAIGMWAYIVLYGFIAVAAIDVVILWIGLRKRMIAKFGRLDRGHVYYIVRRGMMFRRLRSPKPQVKRGEQPR